MSGSSRQFALGMADRYCVERELGAGGMATVYLAEDLKHHRKVAIKVVHAELSAVLGSERFLKEIELTAGLQHPHILPLFDSGDADGLLYYVMPYVDGETLRARLARETQLALPDAMRIAAEVADALDYAHKRGVIHRDIKPENILLRDGHALLADFGIALAVREAGGNRLTQSGLSLGTPQYMSPEQATGNRQVDARSDVYSLGAVLYEMLAGEPPVSGATAQAMIAKLLTERPPTLSVLRETVPVGMSDAVAKALAKTPADRFATAGEFVAAAQAGMTAPKPARRTRRTSLIVSTAGIVLATAVAATVAIDRASHRGSALAIGDRVQLTTSADVINPAISNDGKQLAYFTRTCAPTGCLYSVMIQDVGGTARRSILDGVTREYSLEWSPDRRNLLFDGALKDGLNNTYLLSVVGGPPRPLGGRLNLGAISFLAGGDSLLIGSRTTNDSVYYVRVAALDGLVRDSIRVIGPGGGAAIPHSVPGTAWIVVEIEPGLKRFTELRVIDRRGRVAASERATCSCDTRVSADAIWELPSDPPSTSMPVIRVPIEPATGRLAAHRDTLTVAASSNLSVTADGTGLVLGEGTREYSMWALPFADAIAGRLDEAHRIGRASASMTANISPDGERISIAREVPLPSGGSETRLTVRAFGEGTESPVVTQGKFGSSRWRDSVTQTLFSRTPKGRRVVLRDVRTGAESQEMFLRDSVGYGVESIPGGWAWIPEADDVIVQAAGRTRSFPRPPWFDWMVELPLDPTGQRLALAGFGGARGTNADSVGVFVMALQTGVVTRWAAVQSTRFDGLQWLADGSVAVQIRDPRGLTVYRIVGPERIQQLGTIARPVQDLSFDRKLRRAVVVTVDSHFDAWLSHVTHR